MKLPPGALLQASQEAESILAALVSEGVGDARRIADHFAGIGTFTFALTSRAEVDAFEEDEAAIEVARPSRAGEELARFDAVVLNSPRACARALAEALAGSSVPTIVAVSCDPSACARDLRILVDGGYRITRIVPVDQFLFSPHIELVAQLER